MASDISVDPASEADARLPIIEAGRLNGLAEAQIARGLVLDVRSVNRLAGSRRAWASARAAATPEPPPAPTPEDDAPAQPPASPPAPRPAPAPAEPKRTRLYPYSPDYDERLGQRITPGDGSLPWSPAQLRAATERKLVEVMKAREEDYGIPHCAVLDPLGWRVIPAPQITDDAPPSQPMRPVLHRTHEEAA